MGIEEFDVTTADGRSVSCLVGGAAEGPVVLLHHGTPGARTLLPSWFDTAAAYGGRLLSYSRPGYGGSTRRRGRSVADVADDVAAVLGALRVDRFATVGFSGGGPHALACAALLSARCIAAVSVAGVAPYGAPGLDFLAGMGEDNVTEFGAAVAGEEHVGALLQQWRPALLAADAAGFVAQWRSLLPPVDVAVLGEEFGEFLRASLAEGIEPGVGGWVDDDLAFVRPWGFDLGAVTVPVQVWQGRLDLMVPPAHGDWLAGHVAGADAHLLPDEGHLSLTVARMPELLGDLYGRMSAA